MNSLPAAFVLNPYYTGLGIARSLAGSGISVYGLTAEDDAPGRRSRFFHRVYPVPNSRDEPEALCAELITLRARHPDRPVLFPTSDFDVLFLERYRKELSPYYRIAQPEGDGVSTFLDKLETAKVADAAGVPSPRTVLCRSPEDLTRCGGLLRFPLVAKPRSAHEWRKESVWEKVGARKAILVRTREELSRECERLMAVTGGEVLLQEFIPGEDHELVTCGCYAGPGGRLLGYFTARKLRQDPPSFGTGCVVELDEIPEIIEPSVRLLRAVGYEGPAEIEYKLDREKDQLFLIEVNPRLWDQHELGRLAGVNISLLAYQCAIGENPEPQLPVYRPGSRGQWVAERELTLLALRTTAQDLAEAWADRRPRRSTRLLTSCRIAGVAIANVIGLIRSFRVFSVSALRDPVPGILLWARMSVEVSRALVRRTSRRRSDPPTPGS